MKPKKKMDSPSPTISRLISAWIIIVTLLFIFCLSWLQINRILESPLIKRISKLFLG